MNPATEAPANLAFGRFQVLPHRRELLADGRPIKLGGRAFDVLMALIEARGAVIGKDTLMARVWPDRVVEENNLQAHIVALRKALGAERALIRTVSGRGYQFTGEIRILSASPDERVGAGPVAPGAVAPPTNLPEPISELVGRDEELCEILSLAGAHRLVTLTGAGGIGKTRLAIAAGRRLLPEFADGVWLAELSALSDPSLVPSAVAAAVGLELPAGTLSLQHVAQALAARRLLLVLDTCEHVVAAGATMVETVLRAGSAVRIIATSREPLRAEGEQIYPVPPLAVPAAEGDDPWQYAAVQLFVVRSRASGAHVSEHPHVAAVIGPICRRLDGIPLAIELAAARAAALGIEGVAAHLDDRFQLLTAGRRTALPRHQTLRATLDWSYGLLAEPERVVLRRLAVFAGAFSLEAASAVVASAEVTPSEVVDGLANLVAKSLVAAEVDGTIGRCRLLDTTRVYAFSRLDEVGELQEFSRRHAEYYRGLLEGIEPEREKRSKLGAHVDNVRAALEWCFGANGNLLVGVGLAAAAAPMFLTMTLRSECYRWSERAIGALDHVTRGGAEEMHLQAGLGASSMLLYGQSGSAQAALERGLAIAEARGDVLYQAELLSTLTMFHTGSGDFKTALHCAKLGRVVAGTVADVAAMALVNSVLGRSLHFMGDLSGARAALEASFQYWSSFPGTSQVCFSLDYYTWVGVGLARTLWLQGHPAQAAKRMRETMREAERRNQPTSLGFVLYWAPELFLWMGDLQNAEEYAERLISHGKTNFLRHYLGVGHGYEGALAIIRGDASGGVESLKGCLEQLHAIGYKMLNTEFKLALAQGLTATGQSSEALTLIDEAIGMVEENGDLLYMPEALRVKGNVLLSLPQRRTDDAEICFAQSLDWSRQQGARSWELRTTIDLAALWAAQGQRERARTVLEQVLEEFVEGFDTADLKAAKALLDALR